MVLLLLVVIAVAVVRFVDGFPICSILDMVFPVQRRYLNLVARDEISTKYVLVVTVCDRYRL